MATRHASLTTSFADRAAQPNHPLNSYLFRLMELKQSNLCVSADVYNARDLLALVDQLGPSMVVLKTHYDLVSGWDYHPKTGTGAQLAALARKHGFLIFEDRKFCDIGSTVQRQYTGGTARIVEWAHIINANISAGEAMVGALAEAEAKWRERINYEVSTLVSVGAPLSDTYYEEDEEQDESTPYSDVPPPTSSLGESQPSTTNGAHHKPTSSPPPVTIPSLESSRKGSIVSVTTVTQSYEPAGSPRLSKLGLDGFPTSTSEAPLFPGIEEAPTERGLLLLAQMSSKGNLMTREYTQACVDAARNHKGFVMGYVAQESLNTQADDGFVTMTPGCQLPPVEEEGDDGEGGDERKVEGDGMGQQYNSPAKLVGLGTDIVIVGRGILHAADPKSEAERYRRRAWKAYLARLG